MESSKMFLLFVLLFFTTIFASTSMVHGANVKLEYGYNQSEEEFIDGYKIYELTSPTSKVEVINITDPTARKWEGEIPGEFDKCRTFFMTAYRDGVDSPYSNTSALCPEENLPEMVLRPGQSVNFTIRVINSEEAVAR